MANAKRRRRRKAKIPRVTDKEHLEKTFEQQMTAIGYPPPKKEFRFHPIRRWRADFAWPEHMILVEIEGGTWSGGRHTRGSGFREDCIKYNHAQEIGYWVYRFTSGLVNSGEAYRFMERVLENAENKTAERGDD